MMDAPARLPLVASASRAAPLGGSERWDELVSLAADLAFETDAAGRLVFVAPDPALGWSAATLLGQPADLLLAGGPGLGGYSPFKPDAPARGRRVWLKRSDGSSVCLSFAVTLLRDAAGCVVGARGIGQDVTEQDLREAEAASALRRGEVLDHILWRMRNEVLAPRMMQVVLEALHHATGCEGLAVLDTLGDDAAPAVLHASGRPAATAVPTALALLERGGNDPIDGAAFDGRAVLVCPTQTRFGIQAALVLWREPGGRAWDSDERLLVATAAALVRVVLEHETMQRQLAMQARTDPLTGLLDRRSFMEEMGRRFDRLEVDGLPGTLMYVDLDNFKALNEARGHEAGDEALRITGRMLRGNIRPTDLAARLGGDLFALWLDGAEELGAAERAEHLRVVGPAALAHLTPPGGAPLTLSLGIAARWPGLGEDVEMLMQRADEAMYMVKRNGRGSWQVARRETAR